MKVILYISAVVALFGNMLLPLLPKGSYVILVALLICLLCTHIFLSNKKSFIRFVLFGLSINNLADELFFNPTVFQLNELLFIIGLMVLWILKLLCYDAETDRQ